MFNDEAIVLDATGEIYDPPLPALPKKEYRIPLSLSMIMVLPIGLIMFFIGKWDHPDYQMQWAQVAPPISSEVVIEKRYTEKSVPPDHPPNVVRVEDVKFTFHYTLRSELLQMHRTGETDYKEQEIWLPSDEDGRGLRETVLHELMHVALERAGGEMSPLVNRGGGESIINPAARMLLTIMRDNPVLMRWITREQPRGKM